MFRAIFGSRKEKMNVDSLESDSNQAEEESLQSVPATIQKSSHPSLSVLSQSQQMATSSLDNHNSSEDDKKISSMAPQPPRANALPRNVSLSEQSSEENEVASNGSLKQTLAPMKSDENGDDATTSTMDVTEDSASTDEEESESLTEAKKHDDPMDESEDASAEETVSESVKTPAPNKTGDSAVDVTEDKTTDGNESGANDQKESSESLATPMPSKTDANDDAMVDSEDSTSTSDQKESFKTPAPPETALDEDAMDVEEDDATAHEEPSQEPRRSKREKKSTLVYINGQPVLAKNNYEMKGFSYHQGTDFEAAPRKATTTKPASKPKGPSKPRIMTPHEKKRVSHNETVKQRVESKKERRTQFLASNLSTMEPFLDERVASQLKAAGAATTTIESEGQAEQELFLQPEAIQADMRDYQLQGLNWMVKMHSSNLGMILGDEMGLGKTLQTISLLCYLKEKEGITGPSLVICPLSVLYSWCAELERWAPSLSVLRLHSSCAEERESQRVAFQKDPTKYDVVVTTYESTKAAGLRSLWSKQYFNYLVLDEGHRIKDANSQISQAVRLIHRENALILTGTPLQNNLVELHSLLQFLYPDVFLTNEPFAEAFDLTNNVVDKEKLLEAHSLLGLFMIRRLKTEVEKLMPKKVETKVLCPLSTTQVFWYKRLLMKDIDQLARSTEDDGAKSAASRNVLNNLIMQLRKCCLHPFLFPGVEVGMDTSIEDLIAASGKLAVLDMLLRSLYEKKHRVVLFSQFTSMLNILEDYCQMRGWKYCRFDGSTARARRNFTVNQFNDPDSDCFLFLMSTRAGGMGLNLQRGSDTCILYDSDWNPQPDLQAMARVHRIGQKKTVHVYRLVCNGTIEERIFERAQKKLYLDQMVNQDSASGHSDKDAAGPSKGDLLATLKFGCDAVFGDDKDNQNMLPTVEDIEVITDRSRSETFSEGKLKGGTADTAVDFKADDAFVPTTKLGGIDFKSIRDEHKKKANGSNSLDDVGAIASEWQKLQKRVRKSRIVNVDGIGSGYGSKSVPVLAANNYDLEGGERSVFQQELGGKNGNYGEVKKNRLKAGVDFDQQDHCQVCGDGGNIVLCESCPVAVHPECVGEDPKHFRSCPHHRCAMCYKNAYAAGGVLFPCQSCPVSFCDDCLPKNEKGFRFLDDNNRFVRFGFESKMLCYIHCSEQCEQYAKGEFKWEERSKNPLPTPEALDLSHAFGSEIDATIEDTTQEEVCETRLRKRKVANYKDLGIVDHSMSQPSSGPSKTKEQEFTVDLTMDSPETDALANAGGPKRNSEVETVEDHGSEGGSLGAVAALPSQRSSTYDVVFPLTRYGFLLELQDVNCKAVFSRYLPTPTGEKGPAEIANRVRHAGDEVVAVNRSDVTSMSCRDIVNLLRQLRKNVVITFREASTGAPRTTFPGISIGKENDSNSHGISSRVGAAQATKPVASLKRKMGDEVEVIEVDDSPPTKKLAPTPENASAKQPDPSPPLEGEYDITLPVTPHGLLLEVGVVAGQNVVLGYRRAPDGSKGPAEIAGLVRGACNRIVMVNNVDVSRYKYSDLLQLIRTSTKVVSHVVMRLRDSHFGLAPIAYTKESEKEANQDKPSLPPSANEYDVAIPFTNLGVMLRLGDLGGAPVFLGYRRFPDGSKGPAEMNNLVRNQGDRIVAVNGVEVTSYVGAVERISESKKGKALVHLRFKDETM